MEVSSSRPRTIARGRGRPAQALYMPPARRHRTSTVDNCDTIKIETSQRKGSDDIKIMDVKTTESQPQLIEVVTPIVQLKDLSINSHTGTKSIESISTPIIDIINNCSETICPNTESESGIFSKLNDNDTDKINNTPKLGTPIDMPLQSHTIKTNTVNITMESKDTVQVINITQVESKTPSECLESHNRESTIINKKEAEVKSKAKNVKPIDVKCDVLQISVAKNIKKSPIKLVQVDQWEDLFNNDDESPSCDEKNVQSHECTTTSINYDSEDNENLNDAQLEHILEIYDFPSSFKAPDIMQIYHELDHNSVYIKWINETKALLVLGSGMQAKRALSIEHPFIKSRPVALGSQMALDVVRNSNLRPAMKRPPTSMQAARRMITTALGAKSQVSREVQQRERDALRKAKEERRTQRQNERDAWEGNPRPTTA